MKLHEVNVSPGSSVCLGSLEGCGEENMAGVLKVFFLFLARFFCFRVCLPFLALIVFFFSFVDSYILDCICDVCLSICSSVVFHVYAVNYMLKVIG